MSRYLFCLFITLSWVPACLSADYRMEVLDASDMSLGKSASIVFDCTFEQPSDEKTVFVQLIQDEQLFSFHEQTIDDYHPGKPFREKVKFRLPEDIPSGLYFLDIGIYGNKARSPNRFIVEIAGEQKGRRKPFAFGNFKDRNGVIHRWYVNDANALIWDGRPYLPVGGMFTPRSVGPEPAGDMNEHIWRKDSVVIDLIGTSGVDDVYLNEGTGPGCHPSRMQRLFDYLEFWKIRYGLEFGENPCKGFAYILDADDARIEGITEAGFYELENPVWQGGMYLLTTEKGEVVSAGRAVQTDRGIGAQIDWSSETALNLTFIPRQKVDDYFWDGQYEGYEKQVVDYVSALHFGPGFRFIVDPFANEMFIDYEALPDSEGYRKGFEAWLTDKYSEVESLNESWAGEIKSFRQASCLVPMQAISSASGETGYLLDVTTEKLLSVDMAASQVWEDMRQYRAKSVQEYCNRVSRTIKKIVDVPVVFKHHPQVDSYRINDSPRKGFDGIGMESFGSGEMLKMFCSSGAISEAAQSSTTIWTPVTETAQAAFRHQNPKIAYQDRISMYSCFANLLEAGAKGIFVFGLYLGEPGEWQSSEIIRDPRQLEWMATFSKILESKADRIKNYKPEYDYWFPERRKRDEVFAGSERSYKGLNGDWKAFLNDEGLEGFLKKDRWVLPAFHPAVDANVLYANIEDEPASLRWGPELESILTEGQQRVLYLGYRKDTGSIPYLDVYFTDRFAVTRDNRKFQVLRPLGRCDILGQTEDGDVYNLKIGNLQIISLEVGDHVGWSPRDVDLEKKRMEDEDLLKDVLEVRKLNLGDALGGFAYTKDNLPVIHLWAQRDSISLNIPLPWFSDVTLSFPDGTPVPLSEDGKTINTLLVAEDLSFVEKSEKGVEGRHYNTFNVRNELVITGLDPRFLEKKTKREEPFMRNIVFIEGEASEHTDFNFPSLDGLPVLNDDAFQLLESFQPSSCPDGYVSRYSFRVPQDGLHGIWVRERYLLFQSPCEWRVDDRIWQVMPCEAIPARTDIAVPWSPFTDDMEVFGWYKYGQVPLEKGEHVIEFKVRDPNPITGKFSKGIDVISVTLEREMAEGEQEHKPLVNLLENSSFEAGGREYIPGWIVSDAANGGFVERQGNVLGLERISRFGHHCVFIKGAQDKTASHPYIISKPISIKGGENCYLRAWLRADGGDMEGYIGVRFYDKEGRQIDSGSMRMGRSDGMYGLTTYMVRAPRAARHAAMQIGYRGRDEMVVDDAEFYCTE